MSKLGEILFENSEMSINKYIESFGQVYTHTPSLISIYSVHNDEYINKPRFYSKSSHCPALYIELDEDKDCKNGLWAANIYEKLFYNGKVEFNEPDDRHIKDSNSLSISKDKGNDTYYGLINTIRDVAMGMALAPYCFHPYDSEEDTTTFNVLIGVRGKEFELYNMGVRLSLKEVYNEKSDFVPVEDRKGINWTKELYMLGRFYSNWGSFSLDFESMEWESNHLGTDILRNFSLKEPSYKHANFVLGLGSIKRITIKNEDTINFWFDDCSFLKKNLMRRYIDLLSGNVVSSESHGIGVSKRKYTYTNPSAVLETDSDSLISAEYLPDYPEICSEQLDCVDNILNALDKVSFSDNSYF